MELSKIAEQVENLPKKEKMAILELIDLKTTTDMKEVIMELDKLNNKIDLKFGAMNTKYNVLIGMISLGMIIITILKFLE